MALLRYVLTDGSGVVDGVVVVGGGGGGGRVVIQKPVEEVKALDQVMALLRYVVSCYCRGGGGGGGHKASCRGAQGCGTLFGLTAVCCHCCL